MAVTLPAAILLSCGGSAGLTRRDSRMLPLLAIALLLAGVDLLVVAGFRRLRFPCPPSSVFRLPEVLCGSISAKFLWPLNQMAITCK